MCSKWINYDQPTYYEFRYNLDGNDPEQERIINPTSTKKNEISHVLFPAGKKSRDYNIALKVRIMNKFHQYAEYPLTVKVKITRYPDFC